MEPHRIRQLRWRADARDGAAASALRDRLQVQGNRVAQALGSALDQVDPGEQRTLHLPRLTLRLDPSWLDAPDQELAVHLDAAVREAWQRLAPVPAATATTTATSALPAGSLATPPAGQPVQEAGATLAASAASPSPGTPAASAARAGSREASTWLYGYLDSGLLPPGLAALSSPEQLRALRQAARHLAEDSPRLRLGGRMADFDQRVAWFCRWLALWPEAERGPWLAQRQGGVPVSAGSALAEALESLERLMPELAGERRMLAQAVELAATAPGPVSFDPQRRASDAAMNDAALRRWLAHLVKLAAGSAV